MSEKSFEEIFEELARHNDRSVIWNTWLEYVIDVNLLQLEPGDYEEFQKKYDGNTLAYEDLMEAWLKELSLKLDKYPYYDMLGEFYEELVQSQSKASSMAQFYTPPSVTNLLSELTLTDNKNYKGKLASDPAGGSGRTLLSAHVKSKGDLFCISQDLDETSCKMAVLNFFSHGVRGSVLHMDTLTGEFYHGWRINRYLYDGIPVPHIEVIDTIDEAYDFIGLTPDSDDEGVLANDDLESLITNDNPSTSEADTEVVETTGQTTLI